PTQLRHGGHVTGEPARLASDPQPTPHPVRESSVPDPPTGAVGVDAEGATAPGISQAHVPGGQAPLESSPPTTLGSPTGKVTPSPAGPGTTKLSGHGTAGGRSLPPSATPETP